MGPRLGSRGRRIERARKLPALPALQWGHGSEAVEDPARGPLAAIQRPASMGPRLGSRGRPKLSKHWPRNSGCFNGATARKPWKTRNQVPGRAGVKSFNGATARKPWKTRSGRPNYVAGVVASMGPRLGSRGRHVHARGGRDARKRFNGATARKPWKTG